MRKSLLAIGMAFASLTASAITIDATTPIVLPDNPSIQEKYAAGELAKYLGKSLGGEIKTVNENNVAGGKAIYLGKTRRAAAKGGADFAIEEYQIAADAKDVVIVGSDFRGILYASYDFLERFAGVRFFTPACEVVPEHKEITVPDGFSLRHKPAFQFRQIYTGSHHIGWPQEFRPKFRCNVWTTLPEIGGHNGYGTGGSCHTYYHYSKDFPKEISWMSSSGERVIVKDAFGGSICFSQPEVLERFATRLKQLIAGDREKAKEKGCPPPVFYAVQQNDCNATCFCPECLAFKEKHGLSGLVLDFTNRLADTIKDEYPDVYILIFAYFDTLEPPKTDIRPRKNVLTQITTYTKPFHDHLRGLDDPVNKGAVDILDKWASISDSLAMWDYWRYYGGFLPPGTLVKNLSFMINKYLEDKMIFFFTEFEVGNSAILSFFELTSYVGYKLMDNPALDTETLIDEFMPAYYGAAAPHMRKYLDLLTEKFVQCGPVNEERIPYHQRKYLNDPEFYSKGFEFLAAAEKAVGDNKKELMRIHIEKLLLVSSYIRVLAKKGNPLGLNVDELKTQVDALCEETAKVLLNDDARKPAKLSAMKDFYADRNNLKPTQRVSTKPMDSIPSEAVIYDFSKTKSSGIPMADKDAPDGKAYSLAAKWLPEDNKLKHNKGFLYGMYEQTNAHYVATCSLAKGTMPQDEKYHWYYAGNTCLYPKLILYIHWTWMLDVRLGKLFNEADPNQSYDIYVLLKLQGPAYVKDSTSTNDIRLARFAVLKK